MHSFKPKRLTSQSGFTVIELVLVIIIIGILLALIISTRAGVQQNERNTERQRDVKELRDVLEAYYSQHNQYPTLANMNDGKWRSTNMKALEADVLKDPSSNDGKLADKPAKNIYAYSVTSASGTTCDNTKSPCTQYTLTATLEGGGTFVKNNLN